MAEKRDYILKTFPELAKVRDDKLRDKIVAVWMSAMDKGGWTNLSKIPFTLDYPNVRISIVEHTRRVAQMAMALALVRRDVNMDLVLAGALLHDVGRLLEYKEKGGDVVKSESGKLLKHSYSGVYLAMAHGLPPEIAQIIAMHSRHEDGVHRTPEYVIVDFCDRIEIEMIKRQAQVQK